ncbi:MAG: type I restriction endonuclease [Tissierellia bacterium]|nr:type I restriction endonuclease [Tissierellia bacterium]
MDFEVSIKQFAKRVLELKDKISTEEATKTSLILPFFNLMGYDIFNPSEFVPEFTADFGTKKGEKVDYAILINGEPIILIETKACFDNILDKHSGQLFRYFTTTSSKFGILTNGIRYLFYTDLEETNKLDSEPFFDFDFENIKDSKIKELSKFKKDSFDVANIMNTAEELKYLNDINLVLYNSFEKPAEGFIDYLIGEIYPGRKTQTIKDKFTPIVIKAIKQFKNELLSSMLSEAIGNSQKIKASEPAAQSDVEEVAITETVDNSIVTTMEEIESYVIVRTLLCDIVDSSRITHKDTLSYFGILLDDNIRKWICRVQLKENTKYLIFPTEEKGKVTKYPLESLNDIIKFKNDLLKAVSLYENINKNTLY